MESPQTEGDRAGPEACVPVRRATGRAVKSSLARRTDRHSPVVATPCARRRGPSNDPVDEVDAMTEVARTIPPAPPGLDLEKLFEGIFVFQKWEMFDGVFTPGINPIKELCDDMQLPTDLSGL